jgi:hypothetical protein
MKEYNHEDGYVRETILIYLDPELQVEYFQIVKDKLKGYTGNHGDVINIEILKNEEGPGAIIMVVIVCFKSLLRLLEVTDEGYSGFITKHENDFMTFYGLSVL